MHHVHLGCADALAADGSQSPVVVGKLFGRLPQVDLIHPSSRESHFERSSVWTSLYGELRDSTLLMQPVTQAHTCKKAYASK